MRPLHLIVLALLLGADRSTLPFRPVQSADERKASVPEAGRVDFNRDIRPLLARNCFLCHGFDDSTRKAALRLDIREGAIAKRASDQAAIVPGKPAASLLLRRVASQDDDYRMPPAGRERLNGDETALLRRWIEQGATYERHWSWKPLRAAQPPAVENKAWPAGSVDRFVLAKLESAQLGPAPAAGRRTLIRRLSFDLLGLPPSSAEVRAFLEDESPDAYEKTVDRMLASPHFGERWARHWLDLVRYAETHGHEYDYPIRHAWQYRDYVIRAFNADVPYDRFVTEHIAGDLLDPPRRHPTEGFNESIIATGYWFLGQATHAPVDSRADEAERTADQIDVLSKTFLATTVACARCHDHKFDAVTTKDFYGLAGFLKASRRQDAYLDPGGKIEDGSERLARLSAEHHALVREAAAVLAESEPLPVARYLLASHQVRHGPRVESDPLMEPDIVFEPFESLIYEGWLVEGDAFGDGPQTQATIAEGQGQVHAKGVGFVNSHTIRAERKGADRRTGSMTSAPFTISRRYVHFRIGGGRHAGKTGIQLLMDDEIVRSATGHNSNRMRDERFDIGEFKGREAVLSIVDHESGGWGHVGLDHIVFSNNRDIERPEHRPVETVAAEFDLEPVSLRRWVDALGDPMTKNSEHPFHAWAAASSPSDTPAPDAAATETAGDMNDAMLFEDFEGRDFADWYVTGHAFGPRPSRPADLTPPREHIRLALPGAAHSGLLAGRLQGTLRSRTFMIPKRYVHYRAAGDGGRIRLITDSYVLDEYNALLFEGFTIKVDARSRPGFQHFRTDAHRVVGHRAHIEIVDDGDGYIAVDEIWFSDQTDPAAPPPNLFEPTTHNREVGFEALAAAYDKEVATAIRDWNAGTIDLASTTLLNVLMDHDLLRLETPGRFEQHTNLVMRQMAGEQVIPSPMRVLAIADGPGEDEYVFLRGDHAKKGPIAPRSFIDAIAGPRQAPISQGSGRLELARRLLDRSNPLPARVMVNRVWLHLLGRGIVPTPDDFGALGQLPTHPELLDWLAEWFRTEGDWSTKELIRLLVTSSTYRMSVERPDTPAAARNPNNELLSRMRVRRLQGEAIRDAILTVSGRMDPVMFGPPVPIHLTRFMTGRGRPGESGPLDGDGRRSIYTAVRRNFLSPMMLAFDTPIPSSTIGRRSDSNVAAQALTLLNDPFVVQQARLWAERVLADQDAEPRLRVEKMFETAFARPPSETESQAALKFLRTQAAAHGAADWRVNADAWADLCHALFNVKEFIFLP